MVLGLVDRVGRRLRTARRVCRTVVIRVRFDDFSRATRSQTLSGPTASTGEILAAVTRLLAAARPVIEERGLTMIGVTLTNIDGEDAVQLGLPLHLRGDAALDDAVDTIRRRFGSAAVTRAVLLGRDQGSTVPLLPD